MNEKPRLTQVMPYDRRDRFRPALTLYSAVAVFAAWNHSWWIILAVAVLSLVIWGGPLSDQHGGVDDGR